MATNFLPKGLVYRRAEREPRWVTIWTDPFGEVQPFRCKMRFMPPKRQTEIYQQYTVALMRQRPVEEVIALQQSANREYLRELLEDWENFTIKAHNAIIKSEFVLLPESMEPEQVDIYNKHLTEGMPFDPDFAYHVYVNSHDNQFATILKREQDAWRDAAAKIEIEGNVGSHI